MHLSPPYVPHVPPISLGEEYRLWSSSLCSLLHSPVTSSLLGSDIFLSSLFSNTVGLCFVVTEGNILCFIQVAVGQSYLLLDSKVTPNTFMIPRIYRTKLQVPDYRLWSVFVKIPISNLDRNVGYPD
jgi:hypothetical protein